jgi:hypothetical protein
MLWPGNPPQDSIVSGGGWHVRLAACPRQEAVECQGCLPQMLNGRSPRFVCYREPQQNKLQSSCASAWFWRVVFLYSALISTRATHSQHPYWPEQQLLRYACEISFFCKLFSPVYQFWSLGDALKLIIDSIWSGLLLGRPICWHGDTSPVQWSIYR